MSADALQHSAHDPAKPSASFELPSSMSEATLLDPFPERVRAFGELVKSVAELKLKSAQAELTEAIAAGHWVRARVLETVLAQLQNDFEAVDRARSAARRKIQDLAVRAHAASMLLQGSEIAAFTHARDAYKSFEKQSLIEGDAALFAARVNPDRITADQFLDNRKPDRLCEAPLWSGGESITALQLMDWALRRQYIARTGSRAQEAFVGLFRQIAQVARTSLAAIQQTRDTLCTQVYDAWQPVRILGTEPTSAETRILVNTGPNAAS
jgi:hypothetical protein